MSTLRGHGLVAEGAAFRARMERGEGMSERQCEAEGCTRPAYNRGRACSMHASRMQRHGSYDVGHPTFEERLWSRVTKTSTCWLWSGYISDGYGRIKRGEANLMVHKVKVRFCEWVAPLAVGLPCIVARSDGRQRSCLTCHREAS